MSYLRGALVCSGLNPTAAYRTWVLRAQVRGMVRSSVWRPGAALGDLYRTSVNVA